MKSMFCPRCNKKLTDPKETISSNNWIWFDEETVQCTKCNLKKHIKWWLMYNDD